MLVCVQFSCSLYHFKKKVFTPKKEKKISKLRRSSRFNFLGLSVWASLLKYREKDALKVSKYQVLNSVFVVVCTNS